MKTVATGDRIRSEVDTAVPRHRAWAFLTEARHVANRWGDRVTLQARLGNRLVKRCSDGHQAVATSGGVTRRDPPGVLEMTRADDDWRARTEVAFGTSERGDGTRLALDHPGRGAHPAGERQRLIEAHAAGWSRHLARLADHVAQRRTG